MIVKVGYESERIAHDSIHLEGFSLVKGKKPTCSLLVSSDDFVNLSDEASRSTVRKSALMTRSEPGTLKKKEFSYPPELVVRASKRCKWVGLPTYIPRPRILLLTLKSTMQSVLVYQWYRSGRFSYDTKVEGDLL